MENKDGQRKYWDREVSFWNRGVMKYYVRASARRFFRYVFPYRVPMIDCD